MGVAIGLALGMLLSGCVGIPTSGGISTGPVIDDQLDPDRVFLPSDPRPGSEPAEILEDFMQAVRGPAGNYAVARKFLTSALADTWKPDAGVLIRQGSAATSVAGENALTYTVTSRANVDPDGRYSEQRDASTQTLRFAFVQEDGEWRISEAEDGIVLSASSFSSTFTEQALYFFDPSYRYLVPDVRWFPARPSTPSRVVTALLKGPASWLRGAVNTEFPASTTIGAMQPSISSGTATVDLSDAATTANPEARDRMRQQLAATLGTSTVVMTVDGFPLVTPDAGGGAIKDPPVDGTLIIGTGEEFGYANGSIVTPIPRVSELLLQSGAVAATVGPDANSAVFLAADGAAYFVGQSANSAELVDSRGGLVAPSLDPLGFAWSAQAASVASLTAFDGTPHLVDTTGLPPGARVVSLDVSRDGTRLLLYLSTDTGPRLVIAGITRSDNVPIRLGEIVELPVSASEPVDASWVDERTVAVLARSGDTSPVTLFEIGGPSSSLGQAVGGLAIVGGNSGAQGIRLLSSDNEVWRPSGSGGWASTGLVASFLATQQ